MTDTYSDKEPKRAEVDHLPGPTVLEFGTSWCGYCRRAQPIIAAGMTAHANVRHIRIADGRRRPLGRSYGVKLWPTLIFLRDGRELARLVRPSAPEDVSRALALITGPTADAPKSP